MGRTSAVDCDSIDYGMACLPEELFRVVCCKVAGSIFCYVQVAEFGARMRSDERLWPQIAIWGRDGVSGDVMQFGQA